MAPFVEMAEWSSRVWPALANHLWQATLFALLASVAASLLRKAPAGARYYVWLIALFKFALPSALILVLAARAGLDAPALTESLARHAPAAASVTPLLSPVETAPASPRAVEHSVQVKGTSDFINNTEAGDGRRIYAALTCVWLAGCALLLGDWVRRRRQLSIALRGARPLRHGREADALRRAQERLGHRGRIGLAISSEVSEPAVWRAWRPLIVLPEGVAELLDDCELEAVLMHEVAHVRRRDNLACNFQRLLCCVFWFHPLVWLIDRRLLSEREQACDDRVVERGGASDAYAKGIAKVCRHFVGRRVVGLSGAAGSDLKKRMGRIIAGSAGRKVSAAQLSVVAFTAAAALGLSIASGRVDGVNIASVSGENIPGAASVETSDARFSDSSVLLPSARVKSGRQISQSIEQSRALADVTSLGEQTEQPQPPPAEALAQTQPTQPTQNSHDPAAADIVHPPAITQTESLPNDLNVPPADVDAPRAAIVRAADVDYGELRKFTGRYEVDPKRVENFVLDVTLEAGRLWLKPSHADKRLLVRLNETQFSDAYDDYRFTALFDGRGRVEGILLDSWGRNVTARKLSLPRPSLSGTTTFRLKGYAGARIVAVAGTFNNWNQSQLLFARVGDEWVCRVNLPPGKHQYKFIVDGNWLTDPNNSDIVHDGRGHLNSVLTAE